MYQGLAQFGLHTFSRSVFGNSVSVRIVAVWRIHLDHESILELTLASTSHLPFVEAHGQYRIGIEDGIAVLLYGALFLADTSSGRFCFAGLLVHFSCVSRCAMASSSTD